MCDYGISPTIILPKKESPFFKRLQLSAAVCACGNTQTCAQLVRKNPVRPTAPSPTANCEEQMKKSDSRMSSNVCDFLTDCKRIFQSKIITFFYYLCSNTLLLIDGQKCCIIPKKMSPQLGRNIQRYHHS